MKLNFYGILLFIVADGWCASCHSPKDITPPAARPPAEDTTPPKGDKTKDFVLFHLVRYRNTPVDLMPYLHPTNIANEKMLLNADGSPDITAVKSFAETCKPHIPATLDLETWPYAPAGKLENTIDDFLTVITAFKSVNTHSPIGFYGVPPKQAYQWSNIDPLNNPSGYENWLHINNALAPVAAEVNVFLPSFYTYDPDTAGWRKMVDATVAAIKKYDPRKPVYAYIWPQYHDNSDPYTLKFIDTAIWRYQLQVLYNRVDGCIIWTSNKDSKGNFVYWDPDMPWWQVTKSFLVDKGLVRPFVLDSLYAVRLNDSVVIQWATSADTTTDYFVVQRGADTTRLQDISGHMKPIPTHYTENIYRYADNNPVAEKTYYRILAVDKENNRHYSKIISTP